MAHNISASTMQRRRREQQNIFSTSVTNWELLWISVLHRHPWYSALELSLVNLKKKKQLHKTNTKNMFTYCSCLMYLQCFQ